MQILIRDFKPTETDAIAALFSAGYFNDAFFRWVVPPDEDRLTIVTEYYKVYLRAAGCVAHVAEDADGTVLGATVWLPHDTDPAVYDEIDRVTGKHAPKFRQVADWSHLSEPPMSPFYQLVGVVTTSQARGKGVAIALLKHQLDRLDSAGIPTYLEASTPFRGLWGVYSKFGYRPIGEIMDFGKEEWGMRVELYPCWRPAPKRQIVEFGGMPWRVIASLHDRKLLLAEHIITERPYHNTFAEISWANCDARRYLNGEFLERFSPGEMARIVEIYNEEMTLDKIFLPSIDEILNDLGGGRANAHADGFYLSDAYNPERKATTADGAPCRWFLRTPHTVGGMAHVVTIGGTICVTGDFVNRCSTELFKVGVRPVVWVLES